VTDKLRREATVVNPYLITVRVLILKDFYASKSWKSCFIEYSFSAHQEQDFLHSSAKWCLPGAGGTDRLRVVGVDDWAWKKGQTYGTILVDLERRTVADLLPQRSAEQLAEWLKQHPEVEVITRDRFGLYASGAQRGAPQARQVADRFHLFAESARGGRKRTRSTTSTAGITAGGARPECHEDRAGARFPFPCKSRSANPQEAAGCRAVAGQEKAVCADPSPAFKRPDRQCHCA